MKKIDGGKLEEMRASEENKEVFKKFLDPLCKNPFIMAIPASSEKIKFQLEVPTADQIKKKVVLCQRISRPLQGEDFVVDESNVKSELLFMEVNKAILENLFSLCNDVYMPVLGNPVNVMDMSELVSKDLMDKFHVFLAHTYVTLGSVKGRTQLPLPPQDATSSDKTSSKDKGTQLE
jgi:dynein heavy chain